ncbi:serine--tRNA ligase, partial [Candidatus Marsarchaeota archaeon]|nr:serine--tRNA ligase [Candidatus Marsarchaeota archaeon]
MITTRYVREHIDEIRASLQKRKSDYPLEELLKLDVEWRAQNTKLQELQAKRNRAGLDIAKLKKDSKDASAMIKDLAETKNSIGTIESALPALKERIDDLLWNMPNVLHESVKYGKDETENVEIRKWGKPKGGMSQGHAELLEKNGLVDIERAAKVAGARFYYLKGDLVFMAKALERFALDELAKKGYIPVQTPYLMKREYYK